jgi:hypothetical protein
MGYNEIYIVAPALIALVVQFFVPYFHTFAVPEVWFSLPKFTSSLIFLCVYVLFGFTLYESAKRDEYRLFALCWVLVFLNLMWSYYLQKNDMNTIIFLFLSLAVGYIVYNEIFLSSITTDYGPLYINFYSMYIIWIGFIVTTAFSYSENVRKLKSLKTNKMAKKVK